MKIIGQSRYDTFIKGIPQLFDRGGELIYTGRNTVKSFTVDDEVLVVKRYKRPNIIQRVVYTFFKKSKAERAYLYAGMLRERGFNSPREIAFIEIKKGFLLRDSYFISEYCGYPSAMQLLEQDDSPQDLIDAFASLVVALHTKGVLHGDLNLKNILCDRTSEGQFRFWLIDTNRSKFKQPTKSECIDNMKRLNDNKIFMEHVVRRYAVLRAWDPDATMKGVMQRLRKFEMRRVVLNKLKVLFG